MKGLKIIFYFYLNASIHVALAVYSFVRITEIYFGLPYNESLNYFLFFGTITGYNFVKYAGVAKLHHRSLTNSLKAIQIFSFCSFLLLCYYGYLLATKTLLFCIPLGVITILYAVPFLSGFQKSLRTFSYLKIIVVAFVWCGFTVFMPVLDAGKEMELSVVLSIIQRFLIVIVLVLPFDIRDVKYDAISLQTIPKKIGIEKTKRLGLILMVISLVIEYFLVLQIHSKNSFLLFFFLVVIFLMRAKKEQSKYYSSFWVEALPIFWWLLLLGFHNY
jgi:hypothetical protein